MVVKSGQLEMGGFMRRVKSRDLRGTAHAGMWRKGFASACNDRRTHQSAFSGVRILGWRPEHEISSIPRHALPHVLS